MDIFVQFDGRGVSIEMKKGNEHYEKPTHTAHLFEKLSRERLGKELDWTHVLPVLRWKAPMVVDAFGDGGIVQRENRPAIVSSTYPGIDVGVVFWEDVSLALHQALLYGDEPDGSPEILEFQTMSSDLTNSESSYSISLTTEDSRQFRNQAL